MLLSDLSPEDWFQRLNMRRLRYQHDHRANWAYYHGEQPLNYIARILREQQDRFPPLILNWPGLVIDALEERLTIEGFRLGDSDSTDDDIDAMWQANNLDASSSEGHISSLVTREAYLMVGPGLGNFPRVTVEYPEQVAVETDPRTRRVIAGLQAWKSDENLPTEDMAEVMVQGGKSYIFQMGDLSQSKIGFQMVDARDQTSPLVPIVPMLNRPHRGYGRTELKDIKSPADAANQVATNMMAGIEHHSVGRRWAVGAREADFVDPKTGKPLPAWKIASGAVWALGGDSPEESAAIKVGQFTASDMGNFHNSIKLLASIAGTLYGLPAHYMAYTTDNPVSAEAIVYSEARLVKRAERRQVTFGEAWEQAMRIGLDVMGRDSSEAIGLETVWRDPSTPTQASKIPVAVQGLQVGLFDVEAAREYIGMSPQQRKAIREREGSPGGQAAQIVSSLRSLDIAAGQPQPAQPALPALPAPAFEPSAQTSAAQFPKGLGPVSISATSAVSDAAHIGR